MSGCLVRRTAAWYRVLLNFFFFFFLTIHKCSKSSIRISCTVHTVLLNFFALITILKVILSCPLTHCLHHGFIVFNYLWLVHGLMNTCKYRHFVFDMSRSHTMLPVCPILYLIVYKGLNSYSSVPVMLHCFLYSS